jgi:O-antigen/teichoic acid export membrane protein
MKGSMPPMELSKLESKITEPGKQEAKIKITSDIFASVAGEIFLFLASFLLGILTARFLGADGKGRFNVVYYAVSLLTTIFSLRFQRSFTYFLSKKKDLLGEVIFTSFFVGIIAFSCVELFAVVFHNFFFQTLIHGINLQLLILGLLCVSDYLWNLLIALLAGLQLFKSRAIFMGVSYLLKSALVMISIRILQRDLNFLFFLMGVVETIAYSLVIIFLLPRTRSFRINLHTFMDMLKYSIASFPGMVSDLVTLRIDVFFVNFFAGAVQVGVYTVAISIANMFLYIPKATRNVLMPYIANQGSKDMTTRLSRLNVLILSFATLIIIPIVWVALLPIYGVEFSFSRILFLVLLPGTIFWGVFSLLSSDLEGRGLPWKASVISIMSAIATITLDIVFIPSMGALGAAMASTVTYALSMLLAVIVYRRITGVKASTILIPNTTDVRLLRNALSRIFFNLKTVRFNARSR